MDFPAAALTNFRAIDGFFNLYWRIYRRVGAGSPAASQHQSPERIALKGSDELRNALLALRNIGCLVSPLANGQDLWVFSTSPNFDALSQVSSTQSARDDMIIIGTSSFQNSASGVNTAVEVKQRLLSDPDSSIFDSNTPQNRVTNASGFHPRLEDLMTYSALYEAVISSISRALTLHFTQQQKVIPLGTRTFFTALDENGYRSWNPDSICSGPCTTFLSTLDIDMTSKGKLIISLRTLAQPGLGQLYRDSESNITASQLGNDVWLAPSGILCRLISIDGNQSNALSPGHAAVFPSDFEHSIREGIANKWQWKQSVTDWLRKFGLNLNDPSKEIWAEVEVNASVCASSDAYARYSGDRKYTPQISRILWPAKLCFARSRSSKAVSINPAEYFSNQVESPLQFAERWLSEPVAIGQPPTEGKTSHDINELEKQQIKQPEPSLMGLDALVMPESLARTISLPDPQAASAVYPTPPGGVLSQSLGVAMPSEGLGNSGIDGLNYPPIPGESVYSDPNGSTTYFQGNSELLPRGLDTASAELGIGSGLYDTAGDEDIFGEMDDANFDAKGIITEADFNFFDEPDFADIGGDLSMPDVPQRDTDSTTSPPYNSRPVTSNPEAGVVHDSHGGAVLTSHGTNSGPANTSSNDANNQLEENNPLTDVQSSHGPRGPPISPPLSPIQIKKILSPGVSTLPTYKSWDLEPNKPPSVQNHYSPVTFQSTLGSSDKKYKMDGRFWFTPERKIPETVPKLGSYPSYIPTIGFPRRGGLSRQQKSPANQTSPRISATDKAPGIEVQSPSVSSYESGYDDDSDTESVSNSSSPPITSINVNRKRNPEDEKISTPSSMDRLTLSTDAESGQLSDHQLMLLKVFLSELVDWPLTGYFSRKCNEVFPAFSRREDLSQVAQLVVDQITQSSMHQIRDSFCGSEEVDWDDIFSLNLFEDGDAMGHMSKLDLRTYATLEDGNNGRKDTPPIRQALPGSICKICSPHVRIRRGNRFLEVLPPAIGFWETFGLEPLQGQKNIIPFCLYPPNITEAADSFLERLGLVYSSGNFGNHSRPNNSNGLIPWSLNAASDQNYASLMHALNVSCESLGSALSSMPASNENVVIYIINPFIYDAAVVDICSAFLRLFHKYVGGADRQHSRNLNELVLQIIPLEFIASPNSLVVPTQLDYLRLSLEVYSRCPPKDRSSDWLGCAPPFVLADTIPKAIPFRLAPETAAPLDEGRCLHVAYSQSIDQRWVTAAWTDNSGKYQTTLSYCLRERESPLSRHISEIRTQIWETSKDIMSMSSSYWRLVIVKDEPVGTEETEMWKSYVDHFNGNRTIKIELLILSVNIKPGLSLKLPSPPLQLNALTQQPSQMAASTTPGSTPRPGAPSPDPSGQAGTPPTISSTTTNTPTFVDQLQKQHKFHIPPDPDLETVLVDKSDETWGVTLSHRLNNSYSLAKSQPALASGYLFRRSGISDTDGHAVMSVNIIHTSSRRPIDMLLRDVLRMYRGLATLARVRGIIHVQGNNALPWHIMTAVKGQESLSYSS
ncbi:mediator of RNA polymerase II transcription subunit 13 [Onygenales sp. PD_12]|nr:mediator of RNA polymerase II transcription subunit 13 [Onygenales sp. PD_12]KAK2794887.1 mediator of RNA polymerase II transcription subunit 13 [Onygenales sp. PD_10]